MKKMNKKGFTLIEMLAVIVILGLLMTIAVTNTLSMIDKNKKTSYIEDAKQFVALAQSTIQSNKKLRLPTDSTTALVITLDFLHTNDIKKSPYGEDYDPNLSFVAVRFENDTYEYFVHLVSCNGGGCEPSNYSSWRGISLTEVSKLNDDNRFDYVKQSNVPGDLINNLEGDASFNGKTKIVNDSY